MFSSYIFNYFSLNGYSNALSFKHIGEEKIRCVQEYVQNDLMTMITKRCTEKNIEFDEADKKFFFGIYETDPDKFEFKDGEISLILEIAEYVRIKLNEKGIQHFQMNRRRKIYFVHSAELSIGLFFARKENTVEVKVAQTGARSLNEQEIKEHLFNKKVKLLLDSATEQLKVLRPIDVDIVKLVMKGNHVHADVLCVFCSRDDQTITIQCDPSSKSNVYYWNLSNFKRHIEHHKQKFRDNSNNNEIDVKDEMLDTSFYDDDQETSLEILETLCTKAAKKEYEATKTIPKTKFNRIRKAQSQTIDGTSAVSKRGRFSQEGGKCTIETSKSPTVANDFF